MNEDEIRALEESLLSAAVRSSPEQMARLLSDDFREFGSSGRAYTKEETLRALAETPGRGMELADFRAVLVGPGVVLTTYRAGGSLRSSVWRREGDAWRIVFHQGTPERGSSK